MNLHDGKGLNPDSAVEPVIYRLHRLERLIFL
jgi:hypothetical protein